MNPRLDLGVFLAAQTRPLYVVGDEVLALRPAPARRPSLRVASLFAWARALASRGRPPEVPEVAAARACVSRLADLEFCFRELVPHLRFVATGDEQHLACPVVPDERLSELRLMGNRLRATAIPDRSTALTPDLVSECFRVPCEVRGGHVTPMEPVSSWLQRSDDVTINGRRFRLKRDQVEGLDVAIGRIRDAIEKNSYFTGRGSDAHVDEAKQFLAAYEETLSVVTPAGPGAYRVFLKDRYHELQFSCGCWCLVRGPVRKRAGPGCVYVGLAVSGETRQQRLATVPRLMTNPRELWKAPGVPAGGGMCMGNRAQYQHLFTGDFTDAEAVIQWLNAGVSIASGRSALARVLNRRHTQRSTGHRVPSLSGVRHNELRANILANARPHRA